MGILKQFEKQLDYGYDVETAANIVRDTNPESFEEYEDLWD